jgi:hypothetical protein
LSRQFRTREDSEIEIRKLTLDHVVEYEKELEKAGILKNEIRGPTPLLDYRYEKTLTQVHR